MSRFARFDPCVQRALAWSGEALTCPLVVDRLLDCEDIEQTVKAHGTSCEEVRAAIRPLLDQRVEESPRRRRWWSRRSHYADELWTAFVHAANTAINQRAPVISPTRLMRSILATSSSDDGLASQSGMEASWFESGVSE